MPSLQAWSRLPLQGVQREPAQENEESRAELQFWAMQRRSRSAARKRTAAAGREMKSGFLQRISLCLRRARGGRGWARVPEMRFAERKKMKQPKDLIIQT